MKRRKPHTPFGQLNRMQARWPEFSFEVLDNEPQMVWRGSVRGFQRDYLIQVQWAWLNKGTPPYVFILDPEIRPRQGEEFVDLPHLIYCDEVPKNSALCLFDSDTGEWSDRQLIADTTVPWTSEWLHHYELWHVTGVWSGPNAPGPISVGEMRRLKEPADAT